MSDFETTPPTLAGNTAAPVRRFTDSDGVHWEVAERPFADYDRRRGMSLIFSSESAVRRVRDYPQDWHRLSADTLIALSWRA